jgi:hypothetical protein
MKFKQLKPESQAAMKAFHAKVRTAKASSPSPLSPSAPSLLAKASGSAGPKLAPGRMSRGHRRPQR